MYSRLHRTPPRRKSGTDREAPPLPPDLLNVREDLVVSACFAKLAKPDKLCINVCGDAAIGFTGMDFETAVRERIPIMSTLLNNFSMAIELKVMPISTEKYRSTDISGDYAAMARAFGGYGERITRAEDIVPAIRRGIAKTREGVPVLLEFITSKETDVSRPAT
jgi:thiamine pyrophosphate-dependent acetolactate synthase large subunit-like protein